MALTKITSTVVSDAAVTVDKLADGSITTAKIASGAITADKLSANSATDGTIGAKIDIVQDNVAGTQTALTANINTTNDNVNAITDSTTDLDIASGKYFFDKSATALGISNTNPATNQTVWGTPANVIIYYNAAGGGNVLIGAVVLLWFAFSQLH